MSEERTLQNSAATKFLRNPARKKKPTRWRDAWRALRNLLENPESTENATAVIKALEPFGDEESVQEFFSHAEGRRRYAEHHDLRARLSDLDSLRALPNDSLGRAYAAHIEENELAVDKLVDLQKHVRSQKLNEDPAAVWFLNRNALNHDLWHVLTGYQTDAAGETALLAFTYGQRGGHGQLFLLFGATFKMWPKVGWIWPRYLWHAYKRGRAAVFLATLPYEDLLALPLDDVRRLAGISLPHEAHPAGILVIDVA